MSAAENMALARRLMEARVKGDVDAVDEMLAPDFVSHARLLPDQAPDREGAKWAVVQLAAAFSKASVVVEDQVAAGDKVVTRFSSCTPLTIKGSLWALRLPTGC
jgi:ketosteroid isomerase-like protein